MALLTYLRRFIVERRWWSSRVLITLTAVCHVTRSLISHFPSAFFIQTIFEFNTQQQQHTTKNNNNNKMFVFVIIIKRGLDKTSTSLGRSSERQKIFHDSII